jgi:putative ABC transport system permease protein
MLESLIRDLRSTVRMLAARPGWTVAAILCLAIATGANTAAFTLVNGLLLRPLPFDEPQQLVMVALREPRQTSPRPFALREYRELADRSAPTASLLARTFFPLSLASADGARMAQAELVSGNYFEILRVTPFAGRFFDADVDRAGGPLLAVLSHRLWELRFGANPAAVGQSVRINGRTVTIAGIAPPGFVGAMHLVAADLWLPAALYPDLAGSASAGTVPMFGVMGRLTAGVTPAEASARLTSMAAAHLGAAGGKTPPSVMVTPAAGFGVPISVQGVVLTLSGFIYVTMALLMGVACANVAALVLARGAGRTREIAVRLSLGASRMHIARQLLTESVVLSLAGCTAGTLIALWLTQALVARLSTPFEYVSYAIDVHPDARVFAYSAIATALTAVLCGIAPIRYAAGVDVLDVLKQAAAKGRSRTSMRTLNAMVAVQFAVSTTLLAGAGMLVRTYVSAQSTHPGFDTTGVVAATMDVDQINLDRAAGMRLYEDVTQRLSALPGVTSVSLTRDLPTGPGRTVTVHAEPDPETRPTDPVAATATVVSPQYFQTLGVSILQGRGFDDDEPARPSVAIVNESMARRLWPGTSFVGRVFRLNGRDGEAVEVIGTVTDLAERSPGLASQPAFYRPFPQEYSARMTVLIRVHGDPAPLLGEVRRTMREINPDLAIVDLRTVGQLLEATIAQRRAPAAILSLVGLLGLLLSAVGLYGVVAYGVRERARELGIRLALGARPADVKRLVVGQGLTIVGIGLATGALGTIALAQVVRNRLFGAGPADPLTLGTVCAVLVATSLAALYLPARWASRLEPAHTLRDE